MNTRIDARDEQAKAVKSFVKGKHNTPRKLAAFKSSANQNQEDKGQKKTKVKDTKTLTALCKYSVYSNDCKRWLYLYNQLSRSSVIRFVIFLDDGKVLFDSDTFVHCCPLKTSQRYSKLFKQKRKNGKQA